MIGAVTPAESITVTEVSLEGRLTSLKIKLCSFPSNELRVKASGGKVDV